MNVNFLVEQAERIWYLERLRQDLSEAKRIYLNAEKGRPLTTKEFYCLCGLLCYYKPEALAKIFTVEAGGLRVTLSRGLYRYIETMVQIRVNQEEVEIEWTAIPPLFAKLGYKKSSSETELPKESKDKCRVWLDIDRAEVDSGKLEAIVKLLQQISGLDSLRVGKIEQLSIVLVLEGDSAGLERLQALFREGQLAELMGIPVLDVRVSEEVPAVDIRPSEMLKQVMQLFQNLFEGDWQPEQFVLEFSARGSDTQTPEGSVRRAKEIDLGAGQTVTLAVQLTPNPEEVGIIIWIYPSGDAIHLPVGLQVAVIDESGVTVPDLQHRVRSAADSLKLEFSVQPGEHFSLRLALADVRITESF